MRDALPQEIFDVTIAFLVPENVNFGVLYTIHLTFWIKLYVLLCRWWPSWTPSWI